MQYWEQSHPRTVFLTWFSVGKIILTVFFCQLVLNKKLLFAAKTIFALTVFSMEKRFSTQRQKLANPDLPHTTLEHAYMKT